MCADSSKLKAKFKGGGSIIQLPPIFSEDNQYIYIAWKNQILSYNTKTAKRICEFKDAKQKIIGFGSACVDGVEYIAACTSVNKVIIWKASNGLKLRELKLQLKENLSPVQFKVFFQKGVNSGTRALICFANADTNRYEFSLLNLDSGQLEQQRLKLNIGEEPQSSISMDVSGEGKYFVVAQGRSFYYSAFGLKHVKHSIKGRRFTCVACHPEDSSVITGDDTGRVLLWHNISRRKSVTQAVYHWHTLPVETICFSTSGTYFYSGAAECVLVKWDQSNSNSKDFLPRLPAAIKHITVAKDNVLLAVSTADNAVQIVSPQLNVVNVIQHLALGNDTSAGLVYDSRSRSLILNGIIGHAQFFSPKDMNLMYSLDVVGQNKFTNERNESIVNTTVSKIAINNSGLWMATVEHRADPEMFECRLKFWFYDVSKQSFSLNTSVEYPHEGPVRDCTFQPSGSEYDHLCVTIGKDKKFKVWQLIEVSTVYFKGHSWRCSGEVGYKDLDPQAVTFSNDGSLIVVAFESIITAWLSEDHKLKCSLRHPLQDDNVTHLSMGSGSECHLLFCATSKYISVWNLLSLSLTWTVRVDVSLVVSDLRTPFKAVFTPDNKLFIVDLKFPKPVYSSKKLLRNVKEVKAAVFVPKTFINYDVHLSWYRTSCIYFLDSNYELYSIEKKDESVNFDMHIEDTSMSLFSHLIPKISSSITPRASTTIHRYEKGNSNIQFRNFLETPINAMPPLHLICEGILETMIRQRPVSNQELHNEADKDNLHEHNVEDKVNEEKILNDDSADLRKICKESTKWISIFNDE